MRPLILVSNDDGYTAPGIRAMQRELSTWADVVVCAPAGEQSATSHALTLHRPMRLRQADGCFFVDGTPADCVFIAVHAGTRVLPRRPDLVVSGMNHGVNLGDDVFYSGTVAAAREAALKGIPALAVSRDERADLARACSYASDLARACLVHAERETFLLNVNFPKHGQWRPRATALGQRRYGDAIEFRKDPRGREYLWVGGGRVEHHGDSGTDTAVFDNGDVGITSLVLDLGRTDQRALCESVVNDVVAAGDPR